MVILKALFFILFISPAFAGEKLYALSLTEKVKYNKDFKHFDYVNPEAPSGGEIVIGGVGSFDNLNSNILLGSAPDGLGLTTDSLLVGSLDELSTAYVSLAEYFEIDKKNSQVVFKIKEQAKWHDGSSITNQDLLFSYNILKEEGHPYYKIALAEVLKAKTLEGNKISYELKDINNLDLILQIGSLPVISKEYYSKNKFNEITLTAPLASGPYKIKEVKAGKYIIYERFSNYWGKNLNINRGKYNFDTIKYIYYRDANIAIQGLKAAEYDLRFENIAKNWANSYDKEFLETQNFIKKKISHQIPTGMQCFVMNLRNDKFQNIKVREALNLAFDFEWSNINLFHSAYTRTESFFSNSPYQAEGELKNSEITYLQKHNDSIDDYLTPYTPSYTDGSGNNRRNLIKAKNLLNEAGWKIEDFKLVNEQGEEFKIEFLITSPSFQRVILPYTKNLKKLGINAIIRMADYSNYQKSLENFDFDITVNVYPGIKIPGNEQYNLWHSKYADVAGSRNLAGIKNPLVDQIVEDIANAKSYQEKAYYAKLLDRVLRNNIYVIPHWNITAYRVVFKDKFAMPENIPPYGLDISSWWGK